VGGGEGACAQHNCCHSRAYHALFMHNRLRWVAFVVVALGCYLGCQAVQGCIDTVIANQGYAEGCRLQAEISGSWALSGVSESM
jgi:hypothetical protein